MSVLQNIEYYDDIYRIYGFYSASDVGIEIARSCARLGYSKSKLLETYNRTNVNRKTAIVMNILALLGYVPGFGIVTGILKLVTLRDKSSKNSLISRGIIIRGLLEICCVGLLCFPVDIYVTYKRRQNPILIEDVIVCGVDD